MYRQSSAILWVWFQTTAIKQILQLNESHEFFVFPVHIKVRCTLYYSPLSVQYIISKKNSIHTLIKNTLGLPCWHSGWESACQCRGHGFEPWSGRIPHAVEQLGPCATATEAALWSPRATTAEPVCHNYWARVPWLLRPARLEPVLCNKRSHHDGNPAHCS